METTISTFELRLTNKILRCFTQEVLSQTNHCYNLIVEYSNEHNSIERTIQLTMPFQVLTNTIVKDRAVFTRLPTRKESYDRKRIFSIKRLTEDVYKTICREGMQIGNITSPINVYINEIAPSENAYYRIKEMESKTIFNPTDILTQCGDGLYRIYDNSNRKKCHKNPPFLVLKRNNQYTVIDINSDGEYAFVDHVTPEAIIARAQINFSGTYAIRAAKIM